MITSKDNKSVKYARSLYNTKIRKKTGQFVVEGTNLVDMARNAKCIDYILTSNSEMDGIFVSQDVLNSVSSTVSEIDVVAVCNKPKLESKSNRVLVLDCIQDPGNLGTLVRSALAFNFDCVVCSYDCVDIYNEKTIRSTQGALFFIPVIYTDLVEYLENSDNITIGTFIDGETSVNNFDNVNLVIGNEGNGISPEVEALCDYKYRIEINEKLDSLNASIAGSILMWEIGGKNGIN